MAARKPRRAKTAARPARSRQTKTADRKSAVAPQVERRRRDPETLRLRSFEPSLTANDLQRSLRFYTEVLGFVEKERMTDAGVVRGVTLKAGVCELGLSQDDWSKGRDRAKGQGMRLWCSTAQDIDKLALRIKASGVRLIEEPTDQPWGVRSLTVDDPDGFRLSIFRER